MDEIKKYAAALPPLDDAALAAELCRLKQQGRAIPACIAFVQANRRIGLNQARQLALTLPVFCAEEKAAFEQACLRMKAEFDGEE